VNEHQLRGHKVDMDGGKRLGFSDGEFILKVSAETSNGAFSVLEEVSPLDTPLHFRHAASFRNGRAGAEPL
jgi:hypothetical protein